ncbi:U3 snoRNP protein [Coemansia sp. RSA 487]|nr:U3 snoRNP protein [Coemansia sp. RSA 1843]KAJ2216515.1 U3 snoRNP protein [Coemansia sp. RSA 487]
MAAKSVGKDRTSKHSKRSHQGEAAAAAGKGASRYPQPSQVADQSDHEMASSEDEEMYHSHGEDNNDQVVSGDDDEEMIEEPASHKNSGMTGKNNGQHKKNLDAKATNAEIMALNETTLLFKSNLFKLQEDELLTETSVAAGSKATRGLDAALRQIRDVLGAQGAVDEMGVRAAIKYVRKIGKTATGKQLAIPFPDPAPSDDMLIKLGFQPPTVVNVVGSYPLGMAINNTHLGFNVDMVVQMPAVLFQDRDHLNFRYFYKRAFYMAMLFAGLQQSALRDVFDIEIEHMHGDRRLPIIVMRPQKGVKHLSKLGCVVRVLPSIAHDTLPLKRLAPGRNHVRPGYIAPETAGGESDDTADASLLPATPLYNSAILGDALFLTHMKYLFETTEMCPEFARAAALLRIWHGQRSVGGRTLGVHTLARTQKVTGFVLTMVLAWLLRGTMSGAAMEGRFRLSPTMTAHQMFKSAVEFLALHDFEDSPIGFGNVDMDSFSDNFGAVFVDPSATLNLLAGTQEWELTELRIAARQTALDINHHAENRFDRIFLDARLTDVTSRYDHVFRLEVDAPQFLTSGTGNSVNVVRMLAELEHGNPVVAVQSRIASFLSSALERHARIVAVHPCTSAEGDRCVFFVGIIADVDGAKRLVDLGPNPDAEPEEAARFRAYWGERAELRRFRDASIRLAAVWGANGMAVETRSLILPRMVAYLLRRHFAVRAVPEVMQPEDLLVVDKARPKTAQVFGGPGDTGKLFTLSARVVEFAQSSDICGPATDEVTFERAINAFDELQREIKEMEDKLPLRVLALHPVSPGLRYASLTPPKPLPLSRNGGDDAFIEPLHAVIEFAGSTKWPDDVAALHKVKTAFLLRIAECYTTAHPDSHVNVSNRFFGYGAADGLMTGISANRLATRDADDMDYERDNFLDIRHATSGYTFRLSILCEHEGEVLSRKARELKAAGVPASAQALEHAYRRWMRTNQWRPRHHRYVLNMCQRHHPAASLTIRLLKRWLSRHMLLGQAVGVPEELAELMAACVFTDSSAVSALATPTSAYVGFVRCLQLLALWRWKDDLCVVDFGANLYDDEGSSGEKSKNHMLGIWTSGGMSVDSFGALQNVFDEAQKKNKIANAVRIVTEDDPVAQWWGTVSPVLTRRLRDLAKASLECVAQCVASGTDAHLPQVFTTPLNDYDFVIRLDRDVVCRTHEQPPKAAFNTIEGSGAFAVDGSATGNGKEATEIFKNLLPSMQTQNQSQMQTLHVKQHTNPFNQPGMINFDPVSQFVRDLVDVYGDSMFVFHDLHGGNIIAGLWSPVIVGKDVPFSAGLHANVSPVKEEAKKTASSRPLVRYNVQDVVSEIIRLGDGLIADFVIQRS